MKKLNLKRMLNLRSFALAGIFAIAVLAVSCTEEEAVPNASYQAELKKGKPEDKPGAPAKGTSTITEIALSFNPAEFTQLVAALSKAGLVEFFDGTDQYTVFAPTDAAFDKLYADLGVSGVDEIPVELLTAVLKYHVTDGRRASNSVLPKKGTRTIETIGGGMFAVDGSGMIYDVDDREASIVIPDVSASNGIIHVISEVILPIDLE
jgi:uncharacterized surface protein with fasciclin (FAS1) repeats